MLPSGERPPWASLHHPTLSDANQGFQTSHNAAAATTYDQTQDFEHIYQHIDPSQVAAAAAASNFNYANYPTQYYPQFAGM